MIRNSLLPYFWKFPIVIIFLQLINVIAFLENTYFITTTIIDWVDVFTRPVYKDIIVNSLRYCQKNKGLELFSWCLMTNHIHLVARAKEPHKLSDILRDFKKFTSKKLIENIQQENESRKKWMLDRFEFAGKYNSKIKEYTVWQQGYNAKEIITGDFLQQKINYIHQNPVRAGIVDEPHHYNHSSAIDYAGGKGLLNVVLAF